MAFTWNVVTGNFCADSSLRAKLRKRIGELEPFVKDQPARSVHLMIHLERERDGERTKATLSLRLPRNILRAKESGDSPIKAFEAALKNLVQQLKSQKRRTHGERLPAKGRATGELQEGKRFDDQPQAEGAGPQRPEDLVRDFFRDHYERLLNHVCRHIEHYESAGELPEGAVDPRDIVDEVVRQAEEKAGERPPSMSWLLWMFHLMHEELRRQRDYYQQKGRGEISTEKPVKVPELSDKKLHPLEQIVQDKMEPQIIRGEDVVPVPEMRPDEFVEQKERIEQMLSDLPRWPWLEREVFDLYVIEGFEPEEIAKAMDQPVEKIQQTVNTLRERARAQIQDSEEAPA